jgi:creatinine amidohydrolase
LQWSALTYEQVRDAATSEAVAVLPVGATEQHGPHLATGTDAILAERAAVAAATRTGDVVLPTVEYGCSLGHTGRWAGTLSLSAATLAAVVGDVGRWVYASGFRKLLIVNAHATNQPSCGSALLQLRYELPELRVRLVTVWDLSDEIAAAYREDAPEFHANVAETSLMLHVEPELVRLERAVDEPDRSVGHVFQYAMPQVTASGVVGAPSGATEEKGADLFRAVVDALAALLERARAERDPLSVTAPAM